MQAADSIFLIQNILFIFVIVCPAWALCGKKKKKDKKFGDSKISSNESLVIKSGMAPVVEGATSNMGTVTKTEPTKDVKSNADEAKDDKKSIETGAKEDEKDKDNEKDKEKDKKEDKVAQSLKPFPKFQMPTPSARKKKETENEEDKKKKIKEGFYQQKSDEDDTLEKIESLNVEKSDKTKRSEKKKGPKKEEK